MGTNFYWITEPRQVTVTIPALPGVIVHQSVSDNFALHIGKRSSAGEGRMCFTWATDPTLVSVALARHDGEPTPIAVDEYGTEYTADALREVLDSCAIKDLEFIGKKFS